MMEVWLWMNFRFGHQVAQMVELCLENQGGNQMNEILAVDELPSLESNLMTLRSVFELGRCSVFGRFGLRSVVEYQKRGLYCVSE